MLEVIKIDKINMPDLILISKLQIYLILKTE